MAEYLIGLVGIFSPFCIAAVGLFLFARVLKIPAFCQGLLMALGAYGYAIATTHLQTGSLGGVAIAILGGAAGGFFVGALCWADSSILAVVTLALQLAGTGILVAWSGLTGGPGGIVGVPPLTTLGMLPGSPLPSAIAGLCGIALALAVVGVVRSSRLGISGVVWSDDRVLLATSGQPWQLVVIPICAAGGALGGLSGALLASTVRYLDPSMVSINESIVTFAGVALAGAAGPVAVVAGTALLLLVPEALRFVGLSAAIVFDARQLLFGVVLLTVARRYLLARR